MSKASPIVGRKRAAHRGRDPGGEGRRCALAMTGRGGNVVECVVLLKGSTVYVYEVLKLERWREGGFWLMFLPALLQQAVGSSDFGWFGFVYQKIDLKNDSRRN